MKTENNMINSNENGDAAKAAQAAEPAFSTRPANRGRVGKIARLPLAVRQELNRRMLDGEPGSKLIAWLNGLPEVQAVLAAEFQGRPIQKQNLSEWRKGGFQDYVAEQRIPEGLKFFQQQTSGWQATAQAGLTDQLAFQLAVRVALQLQRLESAPEGPEKARSWRELRACLVALRRGDLDLERLRLQREKYGLSKMTKEEREEEFWKWADENINRDEFCRRRCYTAEEREAAMDKILGLTPQERHETPNPDPPTPCGGHCQTHSDPVRPNQTKSE